MEKEKIYLIDGSGFIFRAFHSMPLTLTRPSDKVVINAVLGFCNMLVKLLNDTKSRNIIVVFDATRKNFRNDIYKDYKANRVETPQELIPQFSIIRQAVDAFNLPRIEMEGYEADDLIATYATQAKKQNKEVVIVSSDNVLLLPTYNESLVNTLIPL